MEKDKEKARAGLASNVAAAATLWKTVVKTANQGKKANAIHALR